MKSLVIRKILEPILSRLGTVSAGYIIATIHVDPVLADQFTSAVMAAALIGVDLLVAAWRSR